MALNVLSALNNARTQYYLFKGTIIAGMGLFTDAYDFFSIPLVMILIGRIYYEENTRVQQVWDRIDHHGAQFPCMWGFSMHHKGLCFGESGVVQAHSWLRDRCGLSLISYDYVGVC